MLPKIFRLPLEWRYRIGVTLTILVSMFLIQVTVSSPEYANDKHSALVNLGVLLFTVLIVDQLTSYRSVVAIRQADEQRILGFNEMLGIYLGRYIYCAYDMVHPISARREGDAIQLILATVFPDIENLYNKSLLKPMTFGVKCYELYFDAAEELGEVINRSLAYVNSSHYQEITKLLIELSSKNNKLYMKSLHNSFKIRESMRSGDESLVESDMKFLQGIRSGAIDQTPEFIETHSHGLSDYALTYRLLRENMELILRYSDEVNSIVQKNK